MATLTVTTNADSGTGSLRQALLDASAGDTITFASTLAGKRITLSSSLTVANDVTMIGLTTSAGLPNLTIDGNGYALFDYNGPIVVSNIRLLGRIRSQNASESSFANCVFYGFGISGASSYLLNFEYGSGATRNISFTDCTFDSLALTNNVNPNACLTISGLNASLTRCTFSNNTGPKNSKGAVLVKNGILTLDNCKFSNNRGGVLDGSPSDVLLSSTSGSSYSCGILLKGGNDIQGMLATAFSFSATTPSMVVDGGYNGIASYTIWEGYPARLWSGAGHLAINPSETNTFASGITRSEYGAGVSNINASGMAISWDSADSTKSVLIQKESGGSWSDVSTSATSPFTTSDSGNYRIWDGATFLTATVELPPQTLVVTNTNATGAGSLAQAVLDARAVDTITFDPSLSGETITLNAGLGPRNEITIVGLTDSDGKPTIIVDGNDNYAFNSSYPVHVSNVAFNGGWGAFSSAGGFDGSTFENCTFANMDLNVFELSSISKTTEYNAISESGATVYLTCASTNGWNVGDEFYFEGDIAYYVISSLTSTLITGSRQTASDPGYLAPDTGVITEGRPGSGESVSFTDCIFSDNDAADMLITGSVNATLSGGNVLTEGIDLTNATATVITNANYNGVGGYTAPSSGSASVAGSGHIALPPAAVVTTAQTVTRSEFGAGLTAISANELTISWTATDSTKSVLLEKQNDATWTTISTSATSPTTVSQIGVYRIWDGASFLSTSIRFPIVVTNTNDSGAGSLRAAISSATADDTIIFDPSLAGETIHLLSGLSSSSGTTIVGLTDDDGAPAITLDGTPDVELLTANGPIGVSNINFENGNIVFYSSGGWDGSSFENCTFSGYAANVVELGNAGLSTETATFADCIFENNTLADVFIYGDVELVLTDGNVLEDGIDASSASAITITNSGYNGIGAYTAPTAGTETLSGSGFLALPPSASITIPATITRSDYGAGVSDFKNSDMTISWSSIDDTKSVLLEFYDSAFEEWTTVSDSATSPYTATDEGLYRIWDGKNFLTINALEELFWLVKSWGVTSNGGGSDGATTHNWTVVNLPVNPNLGEEIE